MTEKKRERRQMEDKERGNKRRWKETTRRNKKGAGRN